MDANVTAAFVYDMAPEGFAGRRYMVCTVTSAPGMPLGPVKAGPFETIEAAERECERLNAADPLPNQEQ
jgi:hypothetical protein